MGFVGGAGSPRIATPQGSGSISSKAGSAKPNVTPSAEIGYYERMSERVRAYLEIGEQRIFASAVDWPGWSRSGRTEAAALDALAATGPRYVAALGGLARGLEPPTEGAAFEVAGRVQGGSGTDFGVPSRSPDGDDRPVDPAELEQLTGILGAAWLAWDAAAVAAEGRELTVGPRGGGRSLTKMAEHVQDSDWSYLQEIGGQYKAPPGAASDEITTAIRSAAVEDLAARVRGDPTRP